MEDKIIVRIMGGLGNQMFQYAWGRYVADLLKVPLELDLTTFDEGYEARAFALGAFGLDVHVADKEEVAFLRKKPFLAKRWLRRWTGLKTGHVREEGHHAFNEDFKRIRPPALLDGYWQSAHYMELARSQIDRAFIFPQVDDSINDTLLQSIKNSESVALHVRRGDYVSNPTFNSVHGTCSLNYYRDAIRQILNQVNRDEVQFFVFSDDLDWASSNLDVPNATLVDNNQGKPEEDLRLMAACRHNILANSSFSWWGAFLGDHPGKVVVAPKQWYAEGQGRTSGDLLPSGWLQI